MSALVFDEPAAARTSRVTTTEPRVNWFLQSTWPEAVEGRRVVNDLYSRFPDPSGHMRANLRSNDEKRLLTALDELLVHDLLLPQYRLDYEEGEGTRPDFRLYDKDTGSYVAAVEVVTLFLRDDWNAEQRRHAALQDDLNSRLRLSTHSVMFEIRRWDATPSSRHMARWIEAAIDELRADPSALPVDRLGFHKKVYSTRQVDIVIEFWPLSPGVVVEESKNVVLGGAAIGGWVDSDLRLHDRLKAKASKYDLRGKPLAIVVGVRDPMCDIGEVHQTLAGSEEVVVATLESRRKGDGFFGRWGDRRGAKHADVSAVFSVHEWFPGGPYHPRITRFDNPLAAAPFPADALTVNGHWGATKRGAAHVRAGWLARPVPPIPATAGL